LFGALWHALTAAGVVLLVALMWVGVTFPRALLVVGALWVAYRVARIIVFAFRHDARRSTSR
jgi:hypothetical protein